MVFVCEHMCIWSSEDSFVKSVLFSLSVGSEDWPGFSGKHIYPLNYLTSPLLFLMTVSTLQSFVFIIPYRMLINYESLIILKVYAPVWIPVSFL